MSVAIRIRFKAPGRRDLYIPVAAQGAYHTAWLPAAEKLGLKWVPLFESAPLLDVKELAVVKDELRRLRAALGSDSENAMLLERIDFIIEELSELDLEEISEIFIG